MVGPQPHLHRLLRAFAAAVAIAVAVGLGSSIGIACVGIEWLALWWGIGEPHDAEQDKWLGLLYQLEVR